MDTKSLTVGQHVYMLSGCYINRGRVVRITPSGVDVQVVVWLPGVRLAEVRDSDYEGGAWYHFDNEGKGRDSDGTHECGPWYLDDMPYAERTAEIEQAARKWKAYEKLEAFSCDLKAVPYYKLDKEQMQELVRTLERRLAGAEASTLEKLAEAKAAVEAM